MQRVTQRMVVLLAAAVVVVGETVARVAMAETAVSLLRMKYQSKEYMKYPKE